MSSDSERLLKVYKSRRTADMYLYVDFAEDLKRVPEGLLKQFGAPELALSLKLAPNRRLARADPVEVLTTVSEQGYYLQMPPTDGGVDAEIERARRADRENADPGSCGGDA
ncbi:MAG: YcgL domain-containing protein [Pseudomonadota bacterium]